MFIGVTIWKILLFFSENMTFPWLWKYHARLVQPGPISPFEPFFSTLNEV